jgi:rfaE bifunctional protein kinase chain/domain
MENTHTLKKIDNSEAFEKEHLKTNKILHKMTQDIAEISDDPASIAKKIKTLVPEGKRIAFISGNFNIVHTGHVRLLNFAAECADFLLVAVHCDSASGALISQHLRLEGVQAIGCVDLALPLSSQVSPEQIISHLQPSIVVKGSEYQQRYNSEQAIVESYGGKLLFSSGEVQFSSINLMRHELHDVLFNTIVKPLEYAERHAIDKARLIDVMQRFQELSVVVIGDLIVDEYITCDALGLSREDPTIVVTPMQKDIFVGGAGIVSAHAKALGANVKYLSVVGSDQTAQFSQQTLKKYGVDACLIKDESRPTTLKQRFRADGKTLLRVSHLRHHNIGQEIADKILLQLSKMIKKTDMLIFSDFNYGCLPQSLVDSIVNLCHKHGVAMVADSQSSSQIGDISRYKGMLLITPTEHEARIALRDQTSGLMVLADTLRQKTNAQHVFITLGAEGLLVHSPDSAKYEIATDQLPAFNKVPKDVSGGGDCLLICTSLALASGANIWESAYLGSIAAACHVGRIGNLPLSINDVIQELHA